MQVSCARLLSVRTRTAHAAAHATHAAAAHATHAAHAVRVKVLGVALVLVLPLVKVNLDVRLLHLGVFQQPRPERRVGLGLFQVKADGARLNHPLGLGGLVVNLLEQVQCALVLLGARLPLEVELLGAQADHRSLGVHVGDLQRDIERIRALCPLDRRRKMLRHALTAARSGRLAKVGGA